MTEYWVSQKQHFCEYCKIFIANNAASKGMHENGTRHKENVAKRLADMRRNNIVEKREKEQMDRDLERIDWKARRQYEKDLAQQSTSGASPAPLASKRVAAPETAAEDGWILDEKTGYYFDPKTKYTYDPNSGLYYTELTGRWTTQEEAARASEETGRDNGGTAPSGKDPGEQAAPSEPKMLKQKLETKARGELPGGVQNVANGKASAQGAIAKKASTSQRIPGAISKAKGVESSLAIKRKRDSDVPKVVTAEEAAAIAAREAAKKRLEDRTKKNYGFSFD